MHPISPDTVVWKDHGNHSNCHQYNMFICYILYMHITTNSLAVLPWVVLFTTSVAPFSGKKFWTWIVHMRETIVLITYSLILPTSSPCSKPWHIHQVSNHILAYIISVCLHLTSMFIDPITLLNEFYLIDLLLLLPSFLSGLQSHTQCYNTGTSPYDIYGLSWRHYFTYHVSYTIHVTTTNDVIGIIYRIIWYRWSYGSIHISYSLKIHPNRNR